MLIEPALTFYDIFGIFERMKIYHHSRDTPMVKPFANFIFYEGLTTNLTY